MSNLLWDRHWTCSSVVICDPSSYKCNTFCLDVPIQCIPTSTQVNAHTWIRTKFHACMHTRAHMHTHTHTHECTHKFMHVLYTQIHPCTHTHTLAHTLTPTYPPTTHTPTHPPPHTHTHPHTHTYHTHTNPPTPTTYARFGAPLAQSLSLLSLHWRCYLSLDSGMWGLYWLYRKVPNCNTVNSGCLAHLVN